MIIFDHFVKKSSCVTNQDMIKVMAQNYAKTEGPMKKMIKSTLKYTDPPQTFQPLLDMLGS